MPLDESLAQPRRHLLFAPGRIEALQRPRRIGEAQLCGDAPHRLVEVLGDADLDERRLDHFLVIVPRHFPAADLVEARMLLSFLVALAHEMVVERVISNGSRRMVMNWSTPGAPRAGGPPTRIGFAETRTP
jgi:hypothetical protein